jgi:hypothetical protein
MGGEQCILSCFPLWRMEWEMQRRSFVLRSGKHVPEFHVLDYPKQIRNTY